MPAERARTWNLQGRQKSCSECAKAKRRCDLQQPSCVRCCKQCLNCIYPPQPQPQQDLQQQLATSSTASRSDTTPPDSNGLVNSMFPLDPNVSDLAMATNVGLLDFDLDMGIGSIEVLNNMLDDHESVEDLPLARPSQTLKQISMHTMSPFARSRVGYSIEQLKLAPSIMVAENGTSWCHPKLYEEHMPRTMQDAHAACALYESRTDANAEFVSRHILERSTELINMPVPTTHVDVLAHVHALMLYQIMLVYSSEVRNHVQVGALADHLGNMEEVLHDIVLQQTDPTGPLPLFPSAAARSAWASYIFRESCRRTLLTMHQVKFMSSLLCGLWQSCQPRLAAENLITISAKLWRAKTAFDFAVAWNGHDHFLVKDLDFSGVLACAKGDDIDVFGRMIMVGLMGHDDVRGWFHTRGEKFLL